MPYQGIAKKQPVLQHLVNYVLIVIQNLMQIISTCFLRTLSFHIGQVLLLSYVKNVLSLLQSYTTVSGGENGVFWQGGQQLMAQWRKFCLHGMLKDRKRFK